MREFQNRFPKGKVVRDRYIIEDLLGQGGFGAVYRVRDRRVKGNVFALKEVESPERHQRESVLFEGEVLRRLDHRALPRVYRVFEEPKSNRVCILMDYVAGPNLEKLRLQQPEKRFPLPEVVRMMTPIVDALTYLHAQQPPIIHRDVKPSNIIVPTSGEDAVLVDFGIAKEYDEDSTTTAIRHCSPGYGAPEQYVSGTATQTDVYGLGATLYTLLSGVVPIDALYRITRMSVNRADPLPPVHEVQESIPISISEALQRAMAINSNDRFAAVAELWSIVQAAADEIAAHDAVEVVLPQSSLPIQEHQDEIAQNDGVVVLAAIEHITDTPHPIEEAGRTTVATLYQNQDKEQQTPPVPVSASEMPVRRRSRTKLYTMVALVVVALLCSGIGVTALLGARSPAVVAVRTPVVVHIPIAKSTQQTQKPTATAQQKKTAVPTATSEPTTASAPTVIPPIVIPPTAVPPTSVPVTGSSVLSSTYNGTAHNTPASVNSSMSLSQVSQSNTAVSGYVAFGAGLVGDGNFSGTVSGSSINFLVPSHSTLLPLFFQGTIQSDGSMSGSYCSYQNNQCDYSGGYGTWDVAP
jgi:eukaryotic-like serine/threonine-protein kinase